MSENRTVSLITHQFTKLIAKVGNRTYHESQGKRTFPIASMVNVSPKSVTD